MRPLFSKILNNLDVLLVEITGYMSGGKMIVGGEKIQFYKSGNNNNINNDYYIFNRDKKGIKNGLAGEFTKKEKNKLNELKKSDVKVRKHEMAHIAASGGHVKSGAKFEYRRGPDGQRYAVAGEVEIDSSQIENDPDATIKKARQVWAAALAPANPSPQDQKVAMQASRMEMEARMELARHKNEQTQGYNSKGEKSALSSKIFSFQLKI